MVEKGFLSLQDDREERGGVDVQEGGHTASPKIPGLEVLGACVARRADPVRLEPSPLPAGGLEQGAPEGLSRKSIQSFSAFMLFHHKSTTGD